jgi:hypothetical protein
VEYAKSVPAPDATSNEIFTRKGLEPGPHRNFDLVVVNPSFVIGPPLRAEDLSTSVDVVRQMLRGDLPAVPNIMLACVDVRDVVAGHVLAAETPNAVGRYILSSRGYWIRELAQLLLPVYGPTYPIPRKSMWDWLARTASYIMPNMDTNFYSTWLSRTFSVSNEKTKRELGMTFTPISKGMVDTAAALIALRVVPDNTYSPFVAKAATPATPVTTPTSTTGTAPSSSSSSVAATATATTTSTTTTTTATK